MKKKFNEGFMKFLYATGGFVLCAIIVLIVFSYSITTPLVAFISMIVGSVMTFFFNRYLSKLSFKQQLRVSNLDKKLEAHQEAFAIWWEIRSTVHEKDKIGIVVAEAQKWWINNCLYLLPKSRAAFYNCLLFATNHRNLIEVQNPDIDYKQEIKDSWDIIVAPGNVIPIEVGLQVFEDQDKFFKNN